MRHTYRDLLDNPVIGVRIILHEVSVVANEVDLDSLEDMMGIAVIVVADPFALLQTKGGDRQRSEVWRHLANAGRRHTSSR